MKKNVFRGELIGKTIEIKTSKNKDNTGINGKIIDETKNTIKIKTPKGTKTLIKNNITFTIRENSEEIIIIGKDIQAAPEERIKLR